jgi:hypothetical protein
MIHHIYFSAVIARSVSDAAIRIFFYLRHLTIPARAAYLVGTIHTVALAAAIVGFIPEVCRAAAAASLVFSAQESRALLFQFLSESHDLFLLLLLLAIFRFFLFL